MENRTCPARWHKFPSVFFEPPFHFSQAPTLGPRNPSTSLAALPRRSASTSAEAHAAAATPGGGGDGGVVLEEVTPSQRLAPPFATLTELMVNAAERYAERPSLGTKNRATGEFEYLTYAEVKK